MVDRSQRCLYRVLIVASLVSAPLSDTVRAQQLGQPAPRPATEPATPPVVPPTIPPAANLLAMSSQQRRDSFRKSVQAMLPELQRVSNEGGYQTKGDGRINLFRVGECLTRVSNHGGFRQNPTDERGLVGVCLVYGDLNVAASETVFAVSIGAWRISRQENRLKGSHATLESIVAIDAEEP